MNAVVFYSNTGESEKIAAYFSEKLGYPLVSMEKAGKEHYENLVLVFPVHCQNIPQVVVDFLQALEVTNLTALATYGKMGYGNVLYEIQSKLRLDLVAGAYIPTKHAYLEHDRSFCDWERLSPILEKIQNPSKVLIPKSHKNPLADMFPTLRSRLGVKIRRSADCVRCGVCTRNCGQRAIESGVVNGKCIRCLKCVAACPRQALSFQLRLPLRLYLRKAPIHETVIYV